MANAWILESPTAAISHGKSVPVVRLDGIMQKVTYTTANSSAAFNANTRFVRFVASADAHIVLDGTADADDWFVPSGVIFDFEVNGGQTLSIYDGSS